jgi:hypothetical protein
MGNNLNYYTKTYSELTRFLTFEERLEYLKLGGGVGNATFGFDRFINQRFYKLREWQDIRNFVITRDLGCDLGIPGYEIHEGLHVHHMNPITREDIIRHEGHILNPEFLITTNQRTHNAIHYASNAVLYPKVVAQRTPRDTKLW